MSKETCGLLLLMVGVVGFLIYVIQMWRYAWPGMVYGSRPPAQKGPRQQLVEEVRASGPVLATVSCSGLVGPLLITGPLITADIHPSGMVISPIVGASAIRADQIRALKYETGFWRRGLHIVHNSRAIASPIVLSGVKEGSLFARTLQTILDKE